MPPINVLNKISLSNILLELHTALQHILFTGFVCQVFHSVNYFLLLTLSNIMTSFFKKRSTLFLSANAIWVFNFQISVPVHGVHKRLWNKGYWMFYSFVKIGCYLAQLIYFCLKLLIFFSIFDISEIKLLCPTTRQISDDSFAFSWTLTERVAQTCIDQW